MSTIEIILFIWTALQNGILIWLCFERDRLLEKIKALDCVTGRLLTKEQMQ